jgi:uncharacterized surface protein with fasciclin (FAS1) repeats
MLISYDRRRCHRRFRCIELVECRRQQREWRLAKLPDGTVEMLLKPENKDMLLAVLTYHVVAGKVMSGDIAGKRVAPETVQGRPIAVNATSGVMVNDAHVVAADVEASNGVIHVIDKVLLP